MFKIEVVAETHQAMAGKLKELHEIYAEGGRYLEQRAKIDSRVSQAATARATATDAEVVETKPGRKGRAAKKEEAPKVEKAEPEAADDGKTYSQDDVRAAMKKYAQAVADKHPKDPDMFRNTFLELLTEMGVQRLSHLPEEKFGAMVALAEAKLAELNG